MIRKLLCLLGFHKPELQEDPFGFGDTITGCQYCDKLNIKLTIEK